MRFIKYFSGFSDRFLILQSILLIALISFIRSITGPELALSLFYLFPITIVSWHVGKWWGISISFASAFSWLLADLAHLDKFSNNYIPFINETFRLIVFILVANVVFELRRALETHKKIARTDPLTDVSNRRGFFELATLELNKAKRFKRSISLLYIDIDNFKTINDTFGHQKGDELLRLVAETIRQQIRIIDIVSRFGGDEFGVLISRADADASYLVAEKLRNSLIQISEKSGFPVTYSMGLVTYETIPLDVDNMVQTADQLMYFAKNNGKNRIIRKTVFEDV